MCPPPPNTPNCPTWNPPPQPTLPEPPPPPPRDLRPTVSWGGVDGVQNRGVAPPRAAPPSTFKARYVCVLALI